MLLKSQNQPYIYIIRLPASELYLQSQPSAVSKFKVEVKVRALLIFKLRDSATHMSYNYLFSMYEHMLCDAKTESLKYSVTYFTLRAEQGAETCYTL